MPTIVAIGGGNMTQTLPINAEIVRLSRKKKPRLLFIPTASSDDQTYCSAIDAHFTKLGCVVESLRIIAGLPSLARVRKMIEAADIIYVGGGNTLMMMRRWRKLGIDKMIITAGKRGAVLCGLSAGAICWFAGGHSDSLSYTQPEDWWYIRVKGLGLIPATACPHFDSQTMGRKRAADFAAMMEKTPGLGIALDDCCAIAVTGKTYRILSARKGANAYRLRHRRGKLVREILPINAKLRPVRELFQERRGAPM